jgi:hypothetical protein
VPMLSESATYRLTFDGRAALVGKAPASVSSPLAPGGRYRLEFGARGISIVDTRTGHRRLVEPATYPGKAYWGPHGSLAVADRKSGLTRLVVFDPASGTRRVVASHLCGDALVEPWSPDGRLLAISVSPPRGGCNGKGGSEVAVADAARGGMRRIAELHTTPVTWSRDGSRLLIAARGGSRLADPDNGKGPAVLPSLGSLSAPGGWSRGRRFYAALTRVASHAQAVAIVDGSLRRVRRTIIWGGEFAWAPQRQWLAVSEQERIRVLDAVTGRTVAVIPARTRYGFVVESLTWGQDGRSLIAVAAPSLGHD